MAMMTMSMSGYYNPHPYSSSNRDGAQRRLDPGTGSTDNDDIRYKRTTWEWESNNDDGNDNKPVRNRENHPHATSSAAAAAEVDAEFGFGSIVPTAKKRRTSESEHRFSLRPRSQSHAHHYQYHPYPYHQMQNQNSSYLQGSWNEERSASAFAGIVYNEAAPATSSATSYKESGTRTRPSQSWHHNPPEQTQNEQGSDLFSDTSIQNLYPNLPHPHHPFQVFPPPSHTEQLTLESNRTLGIVDRHPPHPPSPPRHQFGDEYYMSPIRPSLSPVQVKQVKDTPPAASAVDTKEMKVKANSDNNDGVENSVNLPPDLPNLQVNGDVAAAHTRTTNKATTTSSRNQNIWDRKFDELVSLCASLNCSSSVPLFNHSCVAHFFFRPFQLEFKQQHGHTDVPQTYAPNPSLGLWVNKVSLFLLFPS